LWTTLRGASCVNCSLRCQTYNATKRRGVTIVVKASAPLLTEGFPEVEFTMSLQPTDTGFRYGVLNLNNIAFFTCEPVTYLSFAARAFYQSQLCFFRRPASSLCGSLINMFVFDIPQIPSGCSHICSWCSALTCIPMATGPHEYPSLGLNDFSQPVQGNGRDVSLIGYDRFLPNPSPFLRDFRPTTRRCSLGC